MNAIVIMIISDHIHPILYLHSVFFSLCRVVFDKLWIWATI